MIMIIQILKLIGTSTNVLVHDFLSPKFLVQQCFFANCLLPVACCSMLLRKVETGQTFQPTTRNISFVPCSSRRSATMLGPRTLITHSLQRLTGCILSTMYCRSEHCWELLHPFAHHCQHARNNSEHCWRCCVRFHAA